MKSTANRTRPKVMNAGMVGLILWAGVVSGGRPDYGISACAFQTQMAARRTQLCIQNRADSGLERDELQDDVTAALACCSNMIFRKKPPPPAGHSLSILRKQVRLLTAGALLGLHGGH